MVIPYPLGKPKSLCVLQYKKDIAESLTMPENKGASKGAQGHTKFLVAANEIFLKRCNCVEVGLFWGSLQKGN